MADAAFPDFASAYALQFAWGLLILTALVGWGRAMHRLASGTVHDPDWGLLAGWGMAALLAVGGVLNMGGAVSPGAVVVLVLIGNGMLAAHLIRQPAARPRLGGWSLAAAALIGAVLLGRYAGAVSFQALSCSDDDIAYFAFVQRLLKTGSLVDPFSLRRLAGHGGQTFLQALNVALGDETHAYLVDRGVAVIVAFGLAAGLFRGTGATLGRVLALLLVVLLPFPLLNSASHITGLVMFLTLFRTLAAGEGAAPDRRHLWLTGLVVAGAASLRAHYVAAAALAVVAFWMLDGARPWRDRGRAVAETAAAGTALFLPWMIGLWQSSGTPLYPLLRGTHRPDFENYAAPLDLDGHLEFVAGVLASPGIALFAVPVILYAVHRPSRAGLALYMGSLVTVAALAWLFTYSDAENIHRYAAPFLNAAFIATVLVFVREIRGGLPEASPSRRRWGDAILGLAVLILLPVMAGKYAARLAEHWGRTGLPAADRAHYRMMQDAVPTGAGLFAVVSHPFALDYRRNRIAGVDVPGAASPDPGLPYFRGAAALKTYLKAQGYSFILHRDFKKPGGCLYDRALWTHNRTRPDYPEGRFQAPYYLDLMDNLDALGRSEIIRRQTDALTLIELR